MACAYVRSPHFCLCCGEKGHTHTHARSHTKSPSQTFVRTFISVCLCAGSLFQPGNPVVFCVALPCADAFSGRTNRKRALAGRPLNAHRFPPPNPLATHTQHKPRARARARASHVRHAREQTKPCPAILFGALRSGRTLASGSQSSSARARASALRSDAIGRTNARTGGKGADGVDGGGGV